MTIGYKMNEILNKALLAGKTFMPEMHFKATQIYIQCVWHWQKTKTKTKKECKN